MCCLFVCLSVCSVYAYLRNNNPNFIKFLCMLPLAGRGRDSVLFWRRCGFVNDVMFFFYNGPYVRRHDATNQPRCGVLHRLTRQNHSPEGACSTILQILDGCFS